MIYLAEYKSDIIQNYIMQASENPFATRVKGLLNAYGEYNGLCDVWYQLIDDRITAYVVRYGGEFIADIQSGADFEEIINMCRIAGGTALLCKRINMGGMVGDVMKLTDIKSDNTQPCGDYTFSDNVNLYEYYDILKANKSESFAVPEFEDFYVDLNHRLRKNTAYAVGLYSNEKLICCCVATALDKTSAVIAGVATLPQYKKRGYGTAVVTQLCRQLTNKNITDIFLQRDKNENLKFYKNIGFENISEFEQVLI
ncbi:MAG: GNAT family N-acetyltransferase [Acutalibacteraceae bacterium]|nr:GNAT family N-acetyltransferase [Acutalibacteraceae bacterium]